MGVPILRERTGVGWVTMIRGNGGLSVFDEVVSGCLGYVKPHASNHRARFESAMVLVCINYNMLCLFSG